VFQRRLSNSKPIYISKQPKMSLTRTRNKMMVRIRFEGKKLADCDFWTRSDPYLLICRPNRTGKGLIHVRRTETVRNNLNPKWSLIYISLSELCDSDYSLPLHLQVFDEDRNSRDDFIGSAEVSLQDLINYSQLETVITLKKGSKFRGELHVKECSVREDDTDTLRKMSASSYPERKQSVSATHLVNEVAARQDLSSVPDYAGHGVPSHGVPDHGVPSHGVPSYGVPSYGVPSYANQSYDVPQYPTPLTSSISMPMLYPPYPQPNHLPEDPTDSRPASIWI